MEQPNEAQVAYWNDQAGLTWAEMQPLLDRQLEPLGERGMEALAPAPGERVLDIGCGCGDTSLALARRVAPSGSVLGVDISAPMLAVARKAAVSADANVRFAELDAQIARFDILFDAAFSRFGVMFFSDPMAAFANIRAALKPGGRLAFVCWRKPAENPWMMVPMEAALRYLPPPPPADPLEPGPFAFAQKSRVESILHGAGYSAIALSPFDIDIGGFALEQALTLALRVGPLGRLLRESPEQREHVVDAVRQALAGYVTPGGVRLASATWIVTARA